MACDSFIRVMSWQPVLDKKDPTKLTERVERIIEKLTRQGKDPLCAMRCCASYLADKIYQLEKERASNDPLIRCKNPRKMGSKAWYEYMLERVKEIIGILTERQLSKMFDK